MNNISSRVHLLQNKILVNAPVRYRQTGRGKQYCQYCISLILRLILWPFPPLAAVVLWPLHLAIRSRHIENHIRTRWGGRFAKKCLKCATYLGSMTSNAHVVQSQAAVLTEFETSPFTISSGQSWSIPRSRDSINPPGLGCCKAGGMRGGYSIGWIPYIPPARQLGAGNRICELRIVFVFVSWELYLPGARPAGQPGRERDHCMGDNGARLSVHCTALHCTAL
jgi:hypothetical protein